MVSVYDIQDGHDISAELPELLTRLPEWRLQKALSYRFARDRFLCAKSYLMLEDALRSAYGISRCPAFSYGCHGKPYFENLPDIHFNISHCRKAIACVVSDSPIGIDIEEIQYSELVAKRVFSSDEYDQIASHANPAEKFTQLWTMKESCLKLTGLGITDDIRDIIVNADGIRFKTTTNLEAGYIYTIAYN